MPNRLPNCRSSHHNAVSSKDSSVHAIATRAASVNSLSAPSKWLAPNQRPQFSVTALNFH